MTKQQKTLFALLIPTLIGVFYITENTLAVGNLQKIPTSATSTLSAGNWCRDPIVTTNENVYNTSEDYPFYQQTSLNYSFYFDHDSGCSSTFRNPTYQQSVPVPTSPSYPEYRLYTIQNTDSDGVNYIYFGDHTGQQIELNSTTTSETYSFGGYTYYLTKFNAAITDTENEIYFKRLYNDQHLGRKYYAIIYTSEDLLGEINSANNLQAFMDAGMSLTVEPTATSTRITELITPVQGGLEPDTTVTFNFKIWYNTGTGEPTYDIFGINIENLVDGITYIPTEDFISASGINTFNENKVLTPGKLYRWRAYIRDSNEVNPTIWSNWVEFDVVDRSGFTTSYPGSYDLVATSSSSTQINIYGGSIVTFLDGVAAYLLTFRSKFDVNDATATAARLASSTGAVFSYAGAVFSIMDPSNSVGFAAILMTLVLVGFFLTILVRLLKLILRR